MALTDLEVTLSAGNAAPRSVLNDVIVQLNKLSAVVLAMQQKHDAAAGVLATDYESTQAAGMPKRLVVRGTAPAAR